MRQFSIKDMERFSGVKAHTIRTWERRYGIFTPARSMSNIRTYSPLDLKLLLDISLLLQYGYRISSLITLNIQEFGKRIAALKFEEARKQNVINKLLHLMFYCDIDEFEAELDASMIAWGLDATIHDIILPFLNRAQVLSYHDSDIEVHFVVTAVRRKLMLGIERAKPADIAARTALLFLPKGEHYDLLLLYMTYVLKGRGMRVLYLGTNISLENLDRIMTEKMPDYLYTQQISRNNFPLDAYVHMIEQRQPQARLMVAYTDERMRKTGSEHNAVQFFRYDTMVKQRLMSEG